MTSERRSTDYGTGDTTFQAAGGEAGIERLVDSFYEIMATTRAYRTIYDWHPNDAEARDKLARFLCGWMGGPKRYHEKYGSISIPRVHQHLDIGRAEHDMWINCMTEALDQQPYPQSLRTYLITQLSIPAGHVRQHCEKHAAN